MAIAMAVVVAACGGGTASPGGSSAPSGGASAAPSGTDPSAATPSSAPSGGGTAAGVCELIATDQLTQILQVASVTTEVVPGPPDTCVVEGPEGNAIVSWNHNTSGGANLYGLLALPEQSEEVPGIGDKAAFVENTGLMVLKGDGLVTIVISGQSGFDEADGMEVAREIASEISASM
jgi:hypothetical protein